MAHKEMIYLKGFAKGKEYFNTLKAINVATRLHSEQKRKSGEDYINHPMRVASYLVSLNIWDDYILAAALLHDVLEDCNIDSLKLSKDYDINIDVINIVYALSKNKDISEKEYYENIKQNIKTILIKIADRCHNISTMIGVFTKEKMESYVMETENFILPLCKYVKEYYPEHSDQVFVMKYHIESVCNVIKEFVKSK